MKYFNKLAYSKRQFKEDSKQLIAGAGAGAGAAAILNPLDIYIRKKQNLAGVTDQAKLKRAKEELKTFTNQLKSKNIGKAWFHGYGPKAAKVGAAVALQFLLYNRIKNSLHEKY
jgi:hypothetical protein